MSELLRLQIEAARWANATFGEGRPPHGAIAHLGREVAELAEKPFDIWEYADCLMLLIDAASNAGINVDEIVATVWEKLAINRDRKWGEEQPDGTIEHIRE